MNNFEFIVKINYPNESEYLERRFEELKDSVDGLEGLAEISKFNLDTDTHYLGLLSFVLCGDKAINWFEEPGRAFIDDMDIQSENTTLYIRVNGIDDDYFKKLLSETTIDGLSIEAYPDPSDEDTVEEYEGYYFKMSSDDVKETDIER